MRRPSVHRQRRKLRLESLEDRCLLAGITEGLPWSDAEDSTSSPVSGQQEIPAVECGSDESHGLWPATSNQSHDPAWGLRQVQPDIAEGEATGDVPVLLNPPNGANIDASSATLAWQPIPDYNGPYLVRVDDPNWDGAQAPGFTHDSRFITSVSRLRSMN